MLRYLLALYLVGVFAVLAIAQQTSTPSSPPTKPAKRATTAHLTATNIKKVNPGSGPYYPSCSLIDSPHALTCPQDLGHSNRLECTSWCTRGPARFTPYPRLDVCENEVAHMNIRVDGNALSTHGDVVIYSGVSIDWDDGTQTNYIPVMTPNMQAWTTNNDVTHKWAQARTYTPSLMYYVQHKYDGDGSCSYECRLQAQTSVTVHLDSAPECVGGFYHGGGGKTVKKKP